MPLIRGLMLDVSRNRLWSVETLKSVVSHLATLHYNRLELYFENVFAYPQHPTAWAQTTPYIPQEILALDAFCAERGIELVPNQNTLGHFERWFLADPDFLRYAELPEGGARTPWGSIQTTPTGLCTSDPDTLAFTCSLLDTLLPCFPHAKNVNLGGDEVFDLGLGRSKGKGDKAELYIRYLAALAKVAEHHGKRPNFWADMLLRHPEAIPLAKQHLPNALWLLWGYEASDPLAQNAEKLKAAGLDFLVAPGTSSWRSFCGRTTNMLGNVTHALAIEGSQGHLLTDWGDAGHWQGLVFLYPALILMATGRADTLAHDLDTLFGASGFGELLLRLGDTYRLAHAEAGNATKLFQSYNLPLAQAPALDRDALLASREALASLRSALTSLPQAPADPLLLEEALIGCDLQSLAVERALGTPNLAPFRDSIAARFQAAWLKRGPKGRLEASLTDLLSPEFP